MLWLKLNCSVWMNRTSVTVSLPVSIPYLRLEVAWLAALAKLRFCNPTFTARPSRRPDIAVWLRLPSRLAVNEYFLAGERRILKSTVSWSFLGICSILVERHEPSELKRLMVFRYFCWL